MIRFAYKARDAGGSLIRGVIEGQSKDAVARQLGAGGVTPLEIIEQSESVSASEQIVSALGLDRPKRAELVLLTRQLYALSRAGVPITQALRRLAQTARNRRLRSVLTSMLEDLEAGRDLATAMERHRDVFGPLIVSVVRVGEQSGRVDEAFLRLSEHLERDQKVVDQVKTAIRYPVIVIVFVVAAMFILMTFVVPEFAKLYSGFGMELPLPTRIIIGVANFFAAWWLLLLLLLGGLGYGLRRYVKTTNGRLRWHGLLLRLPLLGTIVQRSALASFSRAFAMATRSGVPVLQALTVVALAVENDVVTRQLLGMRAAIERGEGLARAAATQPCFTPLVLQMLAVGDETGQVDEMLVEVADFYEREVDYDVRNLNDMLQPLLTVIVAVIVFVLALGVLLPMWDLVELARQ